MNKFLRRTVLAALLAALCLTLAACGGSGSDDSAPDTIQDMAKDDTVQFDYGDYLGIWSNGTGDYDSFEVEPGESGEVRWLLYAGANWEYSGYLQYVEEYGYVYAYNDHNGTAYRCELDGAELTVAEIGTFTYGGSGTPDDFQDVEPEPTADVSVLAGDWYQDGDVDGDSRVEITADGVWTLLDCTGDMDAMMDYGELIPSQEEGSWFARSTMLDDVEYNVTVADRLAGPLFLWLVRYHTYGWQNDTKRPARCAFCRARYTYPAFPVMHIPVPRRGRRSRWPIARFYPLLPLLAKVGRSGERNIPAPRSAEHPPRRDEGLQFA